MLDTHAPVTTAALSTAHAMPTVFGQQRAGSRDVGSAMYAYTSGPAEHAHKRARVVAGIAHMCNAHSNSNHSAESPCVERAVCVEVPINVKDPRAFQV